MTIFSEHSNTTCWISGTDDLYFCTMSQFMFWIFWHFAQILSVDRNPFRVSDNSLVFVLNVWMFLMMHLEVNWFLSTHPVIKHLTPQNKLYLFQIHLFKTWMLTKNHVNIHFFVKSWIIHNINCVIQKPDHRTTPKGKRSSVMFLPVCVCICLIEYLMNHWTCFI